MSAKSPVWSPYTWRTRARDRLSFISSLSPLATMGSFTTQIEINSVMNTSNH